MNPSQEEFDYKDSVLAALEGTISIDRMGTYLKAAGFDRVRAVRLYLWNARLSEYFYFPLQGAEVTLRNSINETLTDIFGPDWPTDRRFERLVGTDTVQNIEKTQTRIQRAGYPITTPRIVAGLSFDFWSTLFANKFDRPIWQTRLRGALPNLPGGIKRKDVGALVRDIKGFRNRVAHHEPILRENHSTVHTNILRLIRFRCADTAAWVSHHSRVQAVLRQRP